MTEHIIFRNIYVYTYVHAKTITEKRGNGFEEQGQIYGSVQRDETYS